MRRLRFLFWNLNRKPLLGLAAQAALENRIDVLILAESVIAPSASVSTINQHGLTFRTAGASLCDRVQIYFSFTTEVFIMQESRYLSAQLLSLPFARPMLLVGVHLPSKRFVDTESQSFLAADVSQVIAAVEAQVGHRRTVVAGDFNMNPFEPGMVSAAGFHAVMDQNDLRDRSVRGKSYPAFYNPMWAKFGDLTEGASGTYYRSKGDLIRHPWNIFDQVLIRPDLAKNWGADQVRILDVIGRQSLLRQNGRPDDRIASDHLPITFEVNCE